jgi:hypothetical protein
MSPQEEAQVYFRQANFILEFKFTAWDHTFSFSVIVPFTLRGFVIRPGVLVSVSVTASSKTHSDLALPKSIGEFQLKKK